MISCYNLLHRANLIMDQLTIVQWVSKGEPTSTTCTLPARIETFLS